MPNAEYCQTCGRKRLPGEWGCPSCATAIYGPTIGDWAQAALELTTLAGPLGQILQLPRDAKVLLYGARGSGKSSLAMMAFPRLLVVTNEMEPGLVLAYARRLGVGVEVRDATWLHETTEAGDLKDIQGVVVDSISGWAEEPIVIVHRAERVAAQLGVPLVCINQITVDDKERGGPVVGHYVDVIGRVELAQGQRSCVLEKNRFGDCSSCVFGLGGEAAPSLYYTVTGQYPRYKLAPYPWTTSKVWDAAASGKLQRPPAPAAAAADYSELYGGWVEPPDAAARAAFAERQGVRYWYVNKEKETP